MGSIIDSNRIIVSLNHIIKPEFASTFNRLDDYYTFVKDELKQSINRRVSLKGYKPIGEIEYTFWEKDPDSLLKIRQTNDILRATLLCEVSFRRLNG